MAARRGARRQHAYDSAGHAIDGLRFIAGEFTRVSARVTTQVAQWHETDTDRMVDVTSPDNILVTGVLDNGAVASIHVASTPWAGSGLTLEIFAREGTLRATSAASTNVGAVRLEGAQGAGPLAEIPIPAHHLVASDETPEGPAFNVGQMYAQFARGIRGEPTNYPDFDTAVGMHVLLDAIRRSSDTGRKVAVNAE